MSDLKPCPFCGKDPNQTTAELGDRPCFYYECDNPKCHAAEMGWHDTEQEAIDSWNNRPIEDALRKEIDMLKQENAKLEKLNSAALERLSYHACPSDRNNYGQPCNDSDDCVACWREYLGGKDE